VKKISSKLLSYSVYDNIREFPIAAMLTSSLKTRFI